jgi:aspartyl-tRNA(Asn)/glutamyl-tRNA(Gln) amidotransferase subunit A
MRNCPAVWGSPLFRDFVADHDELPVAKLRSCGAVLLGKTNTPELAMRGYTANPVHGVTRNPWNLARTPGGSSGGAAAAIAAGLVPIALATDGGGSIRRPCAYTNLVGLKPSTGRIRRAKGFPRLMFDCEVVGPIARRVEDARLVFANVASSPSGNCRPPARKIRVLYVGRIGETPVDPEISRLCSTAAERLRLLGHEVTFDELPIRIEPAIAAWRLVSNAGFAALARRHEDFATRASPDFVAMARAGGQLSAADYCDALNVLFEFRATVGECFDRLDLVMTPAAAAQPWPADQPHPPVIGGQPVGPAAHAVFTPWVNACGHPAIAVPAGIDSNGLPVGFQLIAANGNDEFLLEIAAQCESAFPWESEWPKFALG